MSDPAARRHGHPGLIAVIALVVIAAVGWSAWWAYGSARVGNGIDGQLADLRAQGYRVSNQPVRVSGYPFRFRAETRDAAFIDASGRGIRAPVLVAESNAYQPNRWLLGAPEGLTYLRGAAGPVAVTGRAIRAGVTAGATLPRIDVELLDPVFTPASGAQPFPIASAKRATFNLRPSTMAGAADGVLRVEEAVGRPDGPVSWVSGGRPLTLQWEGTATNAAMIRGRDLPTALATWARAGGTLTRVRGSGNAGEQRFEAESERLAVDPDGRLDGDLMLRLEGGTAPLAAIGRSPSVNPETARTAAAAAAITGGLTGKASIPLSFGQGRTRLGPLDLAPAPKVY